MLRPLRALIEVFHTAPGGTGSVQRLEVVVDLAAVASKLGPKAIRAPSGVAASRDYTIIVSHVGRVDRPAGQGGEAPKGEEVSDGR